MQRIVKVTIRILFKEIIIVVKNIFISTMTMCYLQSTFYTNIKTQNIISDSDS